MKNYGQSFQSGVLVTTSEYNIKEGYFTDKENKLVVINGEGGEGNIEVWEWEVEIMGCKTGSRMCGTTWGM